MANRPDIIIRNRKEEMCILISVAIQMDRNVIQKKAENKYKSLCTEIQQMWNIKCMIPVVIGATKVVTSLEKKFGSYTRKSAVV